MNQHSRSSLLAALVLTTAAAMPLAFAAPAKPTEAKPVAAAEADASATSAAAATPADTSKKSWSEVDGDKDGKLTKSEAAAVPALNQVFDQADSNADGALTADEYKSFVAKAQTGDVPKSAP